MDRTNRRRLGVFFFFDKEGIADRYIDFLLEDITKCFDKFIVVSNGSLSQESLRMFRAFTEHIIIRDNVGFDAWAYKDALLYCGWQEISTYYEVVLFNFTIMGPLYSFQKVFDVMNQQDVDFWGLNIHYGAENDPSGVNPYGYLPKHLQSHFIAFRHRLSCSDVFRSYWDNLPRIDSYIESVGKHESFLTKHFEDAGYTWTAYTKTDDLASRTPYPLMDYPRKLVQEYGCPIFKRKSFFLDPRHFILRGAWANAGRLLFEYLHDETSYDTDLIIENMTRTQHQHDYSYALCTNGVLKHRQVQSSGSRSIGVFIGADEALFPCDIDTLKQSFPCHTDFRMGSSASGKRIWKNLYTGADASFSDYEYVCVIAPRFPLCIDKYGADTLLNSVYSNLIGTKTIVDDVIYAFECLPKVGLITSQSPASFISLCRYDWHEVLQMTKKAGMDSVIFDETKLPSGAGIGVYWIRTDWLTSDAPFNLIENERYTGLLFDWFLALLAQHQGFLTYMVASYDMLLDSQIQTEHYEQIRFRTKVKLFLQKRLPAKTFQLVMKIKQKMIP